MCGCRPRAVHDGCMLGLRTRQLRQIDELAQRQKEGGEALNADQLGKIASRDKLAEELKKLEDLQTKLSL